MLLALKLFAVLKVGMVLLSVGGMTHKIVFSKRVNRLLCLFYIFATLVVAQQLSFFPLMVFCLISHMQTVYRPNKKRMRKMSIAEITIEVVRMLQGKVVKSEPKTVAKVIDVRKTLRRNRVRKERAFKAM